MVKGGTGLDRFENHQTQVFAKHHFLKKSEVTLDISTPSPPFHECTVWTYDSFVPVVQKSSVELLSYEESLMSNNTEAPMEDSSTPIT